MYLRLKNKPDLEGFSVLFEQHGKKPLYELMMEDIEVLDTAYGVGRQSYSMGGYLLYFPTENDYQTSLNTLAEVYHFDPWIYEFDDLLWEEPNTDYVWKRRLYMLSSDDALLMIYPELTSKEKGGE